MLLLVSSAFKCRKEPFELSEKRSFVGVPYVGIHGLDRKTRVQ